MLYTSNRKDIKRESDSKSYKIIGAIVLFVILGLIIGGAKF